MDTRLKDKVVIVTGGASGIGLSVVNSLLEERAIPVIVDMDRRKIKRLDRRLIDERKKHLVIYEDLTREEACSRAVVNTIERYGKIDVLINNAGGNDFLDIDSTDPKEFRASLERNLVQTYSMTHFAWPHLKISKGNIVFVSSKVALVGEGRTTAYAAGKAGMIGLTRELATKSCNEGLGIRVNCVLPGEVDTPKRTAWLKRTYGSKSAGEEAIAYRVPLGNRPTSTREVASIVVFLSSNYSAGHMTGQLLHPDGGYTHIDRNVQRGK